MKLTNLALAAILVVSSVHATGTTTTTCDNEGMNFHLWNADMGWELLEYTPRSGDVLCAQPFDFSISAYPGEDCEDTVKSVRLLMRGAIRTSKTENSPPYTVFGDVMQDPDSYYPFEEYDGSITGRAMVPGDYTLTAKFYTKPNAKGTKVGELSVSFTVEDCYDY